MSIKERLEHLDTTLAAGKLDDAAGEYYDKNVVVHMQNVLKIKGVAARKNLTRLEEAIGPGGQINVLAQRTIEDDATSVSVLSLEGAEESDDRLKVLMVVARKWNEKGKVTDEEYLPIRSTADAQTYFPQERLDSKQVQPRLSFVRPSRKRRGKGGGRPRKPIAPTDLHRLPTVGKTVLESLRQAGIDTFEALSQATDDVLEAVRAKSGRRFTNFDASYWREVAGYAVRGEWEKMPAIPKVQKQAGKRDGKVDLSQLADTAIDRIEKVGPNMLKAFREEGIETFTQLAEVTDEALERLREKGGRPFVNFDMKYFRDVAKKKLSGAKAMPAAPKPTAKKASGAGRGGRKPREINPNDLHILPGVGKQLVKALHDRGINTFSDLAGADKALLREARAETRGKFKNIDVAYLQRQAKHAAAGNYDKIDPQVKIEKKQKPAAVDPQERHLARLRNATKQQLEVLPGIGNSVKQAMAEQNITTMSRLAKAKDETLKEIAANSGKRFAQFDYTFWRDMATAWLEGRFEDIPRKPPVAEKSKSAGRKRGGPRKPRAPRTPRDSKDLGALPSVGATVMRVMHENNITTFAQLASSSDAKLEAVRADSGPKYKTFPVEYWREVATLAKGGTYEYPPVPKKEKPAKTGRRGRAAAPPEPTKLTALENVGPQLAKSLRSNGLESWHDIIDAEEWRITKAFQEAGKRFKSIDPEALKKSARDATNGKFPEKKTRAKTSLPAGADKLTDLPNIGKAVQSKLFERGILTYSDLAKSTIGVLEEARDEVGRRVAKVDVRTWKEAARNAAEGKWSKIDPDKYEDSEPVAEARASNGKPAKRGDDLKRITGLGPKGEKFFNGRGVWTYEDVLALSDDALMMLIEESGARIKPEDFGKVQESAAKMISKNAKTPKAVAKTGAEEIGKRKTAESPSKETTSGRNKATKG